MDSLRCSSGSFDLLFNNRIGGREKSAARSEGSENLKSKNADYQDNNLGDFCDFVRKVSQESTATARKAIASFLREIGSNNVEDYSIGGAIDKWVHHITYTAPLAPTTRTRYLECISALYMRSVGRRLVLEPITDETDANGSALESILNLPRGQYADILRMCIYLGGRELAQVIKLKHCDLPSPLPQVQAIMNRNRRNLRQEYVFQLNLSDEREKAVVSRVRSETSRLLGGRDPDAIVAAAWIEAAQALGFPDRQILDIISSPPKSHGYLAELSPQHAPDDILRRVADRFEDHAERWYLVKLRKTPKTDGHTKHGRELSAELITQELEKAKVATHPFYPYRQIVKRIGRRMKTLREPLLAEYLFLRATPRILPDIEARLNDLGRLQRNYRESGRPYTFISLKTMEEFQNEIGQFSPGTHVEIVDSARLSPGDCVRFKGTMSGQLFEIVEIEGTRSLVLAALGSKTMIIRTDTAKICPVR